jgi:RNA polymerase-associated protein LEO1
MQLGSDLYDLAPSYGTTLSRPTDPQPKNLPPNAPGTDTTFLVQANDTSGLMVTENTIAGHLSLVPASSSSKTHIELVRHVGQQHVKHSRMKVLDEIVDPEKAFVVQNTKKKATNRKPGGGGRGGGARKKADSSDDEDEDPRFTYDTDLPGDDDAAYGSSKKAKKSKSKSKKRKGSEEMDEMEIAEKRIEAAEREKKRAKRDRNRRRAYDTDEDEAEGQADGDGEEDMEMDVESD